MQPPQFFRQTSSAKANLFAALALCVLLVMWFSHVRPVVAQEAVKPAVLPVSSQLSGSIELNSAPKAPADPPDTADEDLVQLEEQAVKRAVEFIAPSVARIETLGGVKGSGLSTAICVSDSGLFLTAAYNLRGTPSSIFLKTVAPPTSAASANVLPSNTVASETETRRFIASIVATDHSRNLVLLQAEPDTRFPFHPISMPPAEQIIRTGQTVIAVGKVYDEKKPGLSVGIVSALGRIWNRAIQTDARVSRANYGGPLITLSGDVIGILCPLAPDDTDVEAGADWYDSGIGFAVPLAGYQRMIDQLASGNDLHRGLLGVSMKGKDIFADTPFIGYCYPKSPADRAGVEAGDKLLAIDGKELVSHAQMKHLLGAKIAGDVVNISVLRDTQTLTLTATLTDKIEPFEELAIGVVPASIGVNPDADNTSDSLKIGHVLPDSPAQNAGLKAGQAILTVDGEATDSWDDFQQRINQLSAGQELELTVATSDRGTDESGRDPLKLTAVPTSARPPSDLPEVVPVPADTAGEATVVEISVADSSNRCFAIVPENDFATVGKPGLFVWVSEPGAHDSAETLKATAADCQRCNLMLLIPQSLDQKSWTPGEHEFIGKAVQRLARKVPFDPARVAIGGEKTAGTMACLTAFTHRDQFHGLVMFDALFPSRLPQVETRPGERLLMYFAHSEEFKSVNRLDKIIALLKRKKFPAYKSPQHAVRLIELLPEVAAWTNTLNRH